MDKQLFLNGLVPSFISQDGGIFQLKEANYNLSKSFKDCLLSGLAVNLRRFAHYGSYWESLSAPEWPRALEKSLSVQSKPVVHFKHAFLINQDHCKSDVAAK